MKDRWCLREDDADNGGISILSKKIIKIHFPERISKDHFRAKGVAKDGSLLIHWQESLMDPTIALFLVELTNVQ